MIKLGAENSEAEKLLFFVYKNLKTKTKWVFKAASTWTGSTWCNPKVPEI